MARPNTLNPADTKQGNRTPTAYRVKQSESAGRRVARGSWLVAALVTVAVLVSGVNAVVQVARVLIELKAGQ